jgi:HEAT repeat protein
LTASIICLLVGLSVLFFFQSNRSRSIQIQNISDSLSSNQWQTRVAALKLISQKKLEIANYQSYPLLQEDLFPQERYWLVRTLAFSRRPENFMVLLEYLNDDNLNVRTMALYSIGMRGNRRAIRPIISKIENSNNWYEQMYAYKALRSLGWNQTKSH